MVSEGQSGVIALVASQLAAGGVVQSPDEGEDTQNGPLLTTADAQNLASSLTTQTIINLRCHMPLSERNWRKRTVSKISSASHSHASAQIRICKRAKRNAEQ